MALILELNGQRREFNTLAPGDGVDRLVADLGLKGDRVAVERNGDIVSRNDWPATPLADGDRLEVVHFVGGGKS